MSDDNAYAESLFRTAKYRPEFPAKGFTDLDAARTWAAAFVRWYNHDHRHSGIRYVSSASTRGIDVGHAQGEALTESQTQAVQGEEEHAGA